MRRRDWLGASAAWLALPSGAAQAAARSAPADTLRVALETAETGFDPLAIGDENSNRVAACIFESPLCYDHVARPVKLRPLTAAALPEIADDFRSFTFRIRPGILFADDPVFKGRPRELVAQDYVYSLKRHYDPRWNSPNLYRLEAARIIGLSELRQQALKDKQPFPYEREVEGLRALDRYTFQVKLAEPSPRFHQEVMTDAANFGAVAREVVEFYGDKIMEHPVGTGPFVLAEWRRSSRIVLARNPGYREVRYDEEAPADDPRSQAIAAQLKGRRMPMLDRVEIAIIEEAQPRWLSFLNGQTDLMERLPNEFAPAAAPNDKLAPNLARKGTVRVDQAMATELADADQFTLSVRAPRSVRGYLQLPSYRLRRARKR